MNRLLLSALTLSCLSIALFYVSLQDPSEPGELAIQAVEKAHKPDFKGHRRTMPHTLNPLRDTPNRAQPRHLEQDPHVYEI